MNINGKEYPNQKEFSKETGLSRSQLWRISNKHPEATYKFGKYVFWDRDEFEKIFKRCRGRKLEEDMA